MGRGALQRRRRCCAGMLEGTARRPAHVAQPPRPAIALARPAHTQECPASERASLAGLLEALQEVCRAHAGGKEAYAAALCTRLLEGFLEVEERFEAGGRMTEQEVIDSLRQVGGTGRAGLLCPLRPGLAWAQKQAERRAGAPRLAAARACSCSGGRQLSTAARRPPASRSRVPQEHSGKLQAVLDIVLSHQGAALKCQLLQRLMSALVLPAPEHYRTLLRRLAALSGAEQAGTGRGREPGTHPAVSWAAWGALAWR